MRYSVKIDTDKLADIVATVALVLALAMALFFGAVAVITAVEMRAESVEQR